MKVIVFVLFITASLTGMAQPGILKPDPRAPKTKPVKFFIDSVEVNPATTYLEFISPNQIENIDVNKQRYTDGAVYIKLKDHKVLEDMLADTKLSLQQILKANVNNEEYKKPVLYFLDDKLLTDTTGIRIPAKHVNRVLVLRAKEMPYFKTAFPNALIVQIYSQPPVMYIK